jgi:hypothetical protein
VGGTQSGIFALNSRNQPNSKAAVPTPLPMEHPLVHSLLGKLRNHFGEEGRTELQAEVPAAQFTKVTPEQVCAALRVRGWTATHEKTAVSIVFKFSQPPEASLPLSAVQVRQTSELVARTDRFVKDKIPGTSCIYPLSNVPYRVADMAAKQLRSSGIEVTFVLNAAGRLTGLFMVLPANPARAGTARLTE